jgi:hypothetical protein
VVWRTGFIDDDQLARRTRELSATSQQIHRWRVNTRDHEEIFLAK